MRTCSSLAFFGALLVGAPAVAGDSANDKCAALNYLFAEARTEFPELAHAKLAPGACSLVRQEFKCSWGFAGDRFVAAQEQASRLNECAAAASRAAPVKGKRGEIAYQINPETSVLIGGPEMNAGDWTLTLRIVTSADWK